MVIINTSKGNIVQINKDKMFTEKQLHVY